MLSLGYSDEEMQWRQRLSIQPYDYRTDGVDLKIMAMECQRISKSYITDRRAASGIVGEEHNTDIPIYVDSDDDGADTYITSMWVLCCY